MRRYVLFFTLLFLAAVTACSLLPNQNDSVSGTLIPAAETPSATAAPAQAAPTPAETAVVTETRRLLTVWLPVELAPTTPDNDILEQQIRNYAGAQIDLDVRIEYKTVTGQGGILNYLRTGRTVAPSILPDLVALPMAQLETALSGELIFPLNGLIESDQVEDLYPTALEFAVHDDQIPGYPFALTGLTHLAYNTRTISQTFPIDWETMRTIANGSFVFPANGEDGATLILQMYLSAEGTLVNDAGQTALSVEPLAQSLEQLNLARSDGFLVRQSNTLTTFPQAWDVYETGSANITLIDANTFLSARNTVPDTAVAPVPGITGAVTPLINGWAWAISTNNGSQRAIAADLLKTLITPESIAEWSLQTNNLPARRSAFALWPEDDPYTEFVQLQLEAAQPNPFVSGSDILKTLRTTVFNVVNLTETPQEAAESVVNSLNP